MTIWLPSAAGICRPHWAMAVSRPRVLMPTVLPPVLGPVMMTVSTFPPMQKVMGTALSRSRSGCRALRISVRPRSSRRGRMARILYPSFPRAKMASRVQSI